MKFTSEHFRKGINHGLTVTPGYSGMFQQDTSGMYISLANVLILAQAAFDKWLSEQQVVYAFYDAPFGKHNWGLMEKFPNKNPTHRARVICIEKIEEKKCEHPQDEICFSDVHSSWVCGKCNKSLNPNWTEI